MGARVLHPPNKFENFIVATSTLAQVGRFAQKLFWSSFVKICQHQEVAHWHQSFGNFIVATSTLAQVGGFAQKLLWSSFVKICQH